MIQTRRLVYRSRVRDDDDDDDDDYPIAASLSVPSNSIHEIVNSHRHSRMLKITDPRAARA